MAAPFGIERPLVASRKLCKTIKKRFYILLLLVMDLNASKTLFTGPYK
jgi:hypothetical protein